jgi:hypothetical protein
MRNMRMIGSKHTIILEIGSDLEPAENIICLTEPGLAVVSQRVTPFSC